MASEPETGAAQTSGEGESGPQTPRRPSAETSALLADMFRALDGVQRLVVLTHDNPDPDAIASAAGLRFLLEKSRGLKVRLAFGGIIGRAENRALMEELGEPFERIESLEIESDTAVVLVDTQPRAGNNSLPDGQIATIVVDHHPPRTEVAATPFHDVRPEFGSCASMVVEYLRAARLEPERRLATALFYGIQSETMDLGREASRADVDASIYLYPRCDPGAISRIRHARVPRGLFRSIHEGLEQAWSRGGVVCVPAGRLDYPDLVAQLADFFLRVQGVEWVIAAGRHADSLLLSLRTFEPHAHAGELVREVVNDRGSAGGHGEMAGARIELGGLKEADVKALQTELFEAFCAKLGVMDEEARPLVPVRGSGAGGTSGGAT